MASRHTQRHHRDFAQRCIKQVCSAFFFLSALPPELCLKRAFYQKRTSAYAQPVQLTRPDSETVLEVNSLLEDEP